MTQDSLGFKKFNGDAPILLRNRYIRATMLSNDRRFIRSTKSYYGKLKMYNTYDEKTTIVDDRDLLEINSSVVDELFNIDKSVQYKELTHIGLNISSKLIELETEMNLLEYSDDLHMMLWSAKTIDEFIYYLEDNYVIEEEETLIFYRKRLLDVVLLLDSLTVLENEILHESIREVS
jgi:hypothetical protein